MISTISTCTTLFVSALAILCTALLFSFVRQQIKRSARHDFVRTTSGSSIAVTGSVTGGIDSRNSQKQDDRSRLVRTQSILYTANNINNFVWLLLFNLLVLNSLDDEKIHDKDTAVFTSGILLFLFKPLHGFFNFCIYCYPRFRRIKKHFPQNSWWWCLRLLYTKDEGESEIIQQRLLQRHRLSREHNLESSMGAISYCGAEEQLDQPQPEMAKSNLATLNDSGATKLGLSLVDDSDYSDVEKEKNQPEASIERFDEETVLAVVDQAQCKDSNIDC